MELLTYILRVLSFSSGALLCYGAAFMYEDEEKKVQNVLENWWIRVDDLKRVAVTRHTATSKAAAEFAGTVLDRIFGMKIISLRAVAVAGCLSLSSLHLVGMLIQNSVAQRSPNYHVDISKFVNPWDALYAALADCLHLITALYFSLAVPSNPTLMNLVGIFAIIAVVLATFVKRLCWLPLTVFIAFVMVYLIAPMFSKPYPSVVFLK